MPRVTLKKKDYMVEDFPGWISGRMHKLGIRQTALAQNLGISQPCLSKRLSPPRGKKAERKEIDLFSYGDLLTLFKELEATDEEILQLMKL